MYKKARKKYLASESLFKQILGALLEHWLLLWALLLMVFIPFFIFWTAPNITCEIIQNFWYRLVLLTLLVSVAISSCRTLTDVFSLRKKETSITWCQISILVFIGLWIIGFMIIFNTKSHPQFGAALTIFGTLTAWIFQDTIKGVVAFIHLRLNHQLRIGDWIQVPNYNVDGVVTHVTLTNVTLYNRDTTTSTIPTSVLHSDSFVNLQKMREGKTYGRRMCKTFILNTDWFHEMSVEEVEDLRQKEEVLRYLPMEEIKVGIINAKLFRLYLFHWLMNHPCISQQPALFVRWMEQKESGMPLQVYAFITETTLPSFEWQQSQIMEHIIKSMNWFGLRLFQSEAGYGAKECNIHIMEDTASSRKEAEQ